MVLGLILIIQTLPTLRVPTNNQMTDTSFDREVNPTSIQVFFMYFIFFSFPHLMGDGRGAHVRLMCKINADDRLSDHLSATDVNR